MEIWVDYEDEKINKKNCKINKTEEAPMNSIICSIQKSPQIPVNKKPASRLMRAVDISSVTRLFSYHFKVNLGIVAVTEIDCRLVGSQFFYFICYVDALTVNLVTLLVSDGPC